MLPEEQASNSRYLYELASGRFGYSLDKVARCQAFHFKGGQGAKTRTGGHLPGNKVVGKIADVRGLKEGEAAISPPRFPDLETAEDFKRVAEEVRQVTGGIPIGFKLSAQHIEKDLDFALAVGIDYLILDGRGGGTGSAPNLFKENISVPTIPALARARGHLDRAGVSRDVTLIITGGLRIDAAHRLARFFESSVELMAVLARACGYNRLSDFNRDDLTTFKRPLADLTGVPYGGIGV